MMEETKTEMLSLASILAEENNFSEGLKNHFINGFGNFLNGEPLSVKMGETLLNKESRAFLSGYFSALMQKKEVTPEQFLAMKVVAFTILFSGQFSFIYNKTERTFEFYSHLNQRGSWIYWNEEIKLTEDFHSLFPNRRLRLTSDEVNGGSISSEV